MGQILNLLNSPHPAFLPATTLNRLFMNRVSLSMTRRQVNRPPVLRAVPGPIGLSILSVLNLLNAALWA